jgi:hypothetical protein
MGGAGVGGTGGASGGTAGSGGTGTNTGGTGITVCPAPQGAEASLPLTVDPIFAPSGYFAGPITNIPGILHEECESRPAEHTIGLCHKWTFQATELEGEGAYGGAFWQYGANNWGDRAGLKVASGATKVRFKAWGAVGGEVVQFNAGGISDPLYPCADQVNLGTTGGTFATLTTTPTTYEVDLLGQTYMTVIGAFSWSTQVVSVSEVVTFYVDEIQWVAE